MAKALKTIGMIAGAVALVATGVGAFAAAGSALAAGAASVATYAGLAAGVANVGAQLAYKPPPARGSVNRILIEAEAPQPYVMGEGYFAGVLRHDTAYGATLKKVPNPYRWLVCVYSGGGPIEQITPWVDQGAVSGWYSGFLYTDTQLGACPESSALTPNFAGAPGWDSSSKLSGLAAIGWNLKFDKDGKVFASGMPQLGAYGKWVKAYDPRLDSTQPGGSGPHRVDDETTWEWTENPALHAGTYAYGRHQNGKRVMGCGLTAINWSTVAAWASVCEANGWTIFGPVWEPVSDTRWPNLQEICAPGGGVPILTGAGLDFYYPAPRVALDTFTDADLADRPGSVTAMTSRRERLNTIAPKFRSPAHQWELVTAPTAVTSATYVTEDGEERKAEWPFNLVKDKDQAAELAAYKVADSREMQPIVLTYNERVRAYRPGDCVHLSHDILALDHDAVIVHREFDQVSLTTTFTFMTETAAKHAWALGRTGSAPPSPSLAQTGQERDELSAEAGQPYGWQIAQIRNAAVKRPRDASDVARALLTASDAGSTATISVARHDWDYPAGTADVTRALGTITGLSFGTVYYVYFDDATLENAAPTYAATTDPAQAQNSTDHPERHPLGTIRTPADGGAATEGGIGPNYGYGALTDAAANFGNRLERDGSTPPSVTIATDGSAVEHNANLLGVDMRFAWTISAANEALIHGCEVMLYQSASASAYTPGTTPAQEQRTLVGPKTRGLVAHVTDPTAYYTWAIRTFRNVDKDVNADGRIYSAWVKPSISSENPYRPSTSAEIADSVKIGSGGNTASNVSTWAGYASAGLNSDGSVKDDKVGTGAIIDEALIKAGWAVQTATTGITNETYDMSFGSAITTSGPRLTLRANLIYRIVKTNPAQDDEYSFDVKGLLVQTVSPFTTYTFQTQTISYKWLWSSRTGTFYTEKIGLALEWTVDGQAGSTYQPGLRFIVPAGFTVEIVGAHYLKIDDIKVAQ